jgi:two-component system phosphate regulon sensor histidine kinase PhoR
MQRDLLRTGGFVIAVGVLAAATVRLAAGDDGRAVLRDAAVTAAGLVAVGFPLARRLARRLGEPLGRLDTAARRLAAADFSPAPPVAGPPEVSAVAASLTVAALNLGTTFARLDDDRERLRAVLSGMVEGVVAFDPDQRVLFANDRAAVLLEFDPARAVGKKLWELTRQRSIQAAAEKGLAATGPHREELDWAGPTEKSLVAYVSRLPGSATGAVMVLHDTTELRRLERLRQDFVANVSHELKTPLANIRSSVEVLQDGAADDPAARGGFLDEIDQAARRLSDLVTDLLSLARLEGGSATLEFGPVNVDEAVHACLDRHRTRAEAKQLAVSGVALGDSPPTLAVWADDEAVAQVLDNLVDNAVKYTPSGGRVTVRWEATPQQVCLEVADTGVGIPAKDLPRVFERFYRVDKARNRAQGGTGLGLAIVKHMVQALGGTVRVTSEVGTGTTFRVCLPRAGG